MALLDTHQLTVTFGGLRALDSVDISVEAGSFVGLIGPNGAGKTTFIDAISGFVKPSSGTTTFDGNDIGHSEPNHRARAGLSRTFQQTELFEDLTIEHNLLVAAERPRWADLFRDIIAPNRASEHSDDVQWALETVGLADQAQRFPSELSHGQRKLAGVARAIAARPQLVLLDEPAAGLDTTESQALGTRLRSLLEHDVSVFLIDHDMSLVMSACDYVYVLDFGRVIAQGTPAEVRTNPAVISAYLGTEAPS